MSVVIKGEKYRAWLFDGTIEIRRVARDAEWADVRVTQSNGASWTRRQSLVNGSLPGAVVRVA